MGLLHELGVLDFLLQKGISQSKIAALLSLIINGSEDNIVKDLSLRNADNSNFKKEGVYKFLLSKFAELKLTDLEEKAQKTLITIQDRKDD